MHYWYHYSMYNTGKGSWILPHVWKKSYVVEKVNIFIKKSHGSLQNLRKCQYSRKLAMWYVLVWHVDMLPHQIPQVLMRNVAPLLVVGKKYLLYEVSGNCELMIIHLNFGGLELCKEIENGTEIKFICTLEAWNYVRKLKMVQKQNSTSSSRH